MDLFEEKMYRKRRNQVRFFLMLPVLIALALGAVLFVFTYRINSFNLDLQLLGDETIVLEYGESYTEHGAKALFYGTYLLRDGLVVDVVTQGEVDTSRLGTYQIHYMAEHESWKEEKVRNVEVVDTVPPVIWLAETPGSYVIPGNHYREEGFMARDNYDGDLTDLVQKTILKDRIIYRVEDSSGNKAEVVREIVYYDPIPPELTSATTLSIMFFIIIKKRT